MCTCVCETNPPGEPGRRAKKRHHFTKRTQFGLREVVKADGGHCLPSLPIEANSDQEFLTQLCKCKEEMDEDITVLFVFRNAGLTLFRKDV